jgi:hypothetical protein
MARYPTGFGGRPLLSLPGDNTNKGYAITGVTASSRTETGFFAGMWAGASGGNRCSLVGGSNDGGRQVAIEPNGELAILKAGIAYILNGSTSIATTGTPFVIGWKLTSTTAVVRLNGNTAETSTDSNTFTGSFTTRGAGYLHPKCVAENLENVGGDMEEFIAGIKKNSRIPEDELEKVSAEIGGDGGGDGDDE